VGYNIKITNTKTHEKYKSTKEVILG